MALYSVYIRSNSGHPAAEKTQLIKSGFSWLAFLFPILWVLFHRIWRWFLVILALEIGLAVLAQYISLPDWSLLLAGLAVMTYVGVGGRDWLGAALERRGFRLMATNIAGENEDEAYAAFIRRPKPNPAVIGGSKSIKSAETGPVIGLFPDPEAKF